MPYQILPHTADVRMKISGKSQEELFHDSVLGLMTMIKPGKTEPAGKTRQIVLASQDTAALLVDFLNAVLTTSHINKEIYPQVRFARLSATDLKAELTAEKTEHFKKDIKAVTYHEAKVSRNRDGEWGVTLVFDI